jgi:hypothetical protein
MKTEPVETTGIMGNFTTTLMTSGESLTETVVEHGATIIATGGKEYTPSEYLYGKNPNVLTHFDLDAAMECRRPPSVCGPERGLHPVCRVAYPGAAILQPVVLHPHRQERPES